MRSLLLASALALAPLAAIAGAGDGVKQSDFMKTQMQSCSLGDTSVPRLGCMDVKPPASRTPPVQTTGSTKPRTSGRPTPR